MFDVEAPSDASCAVREGLLDLTVDVHVERGAFGACALTADSRRSPR